MKDLLVVDPEGVATVVVVPVGSAVINKAAVLLCLVSRRVAPPVVATNGRARRSLQSAVAVVNVAEEVVVAAVDNQNRFSMDLSSRWNGLKTAGCLRRQLLIWRLLLNRCRVS